MTTSATVTITTMAEALDAAALGWGLYEQALVGHHALLTRVASGNPLPPDLARQLAAQAAQCLEESQATRRAFREWAMARLAQPSRPPEPVRPVEPHGPDHVTWVERQRVCWGARLVEAVLGSATPRRLRTDMARWVHTAAHEALIAAGCARDAMKE